MPAPFSPIDVAVLVLLALYASRGARMGLARAAVDFVGLGASLLLALGWYRVVAAAAADLVPLPLGVSRLLAFLLVWVVADVAWHALARRLFQSLHIGRGGAASAALGTMPGMAKGALIAVVWMALLLAVPLPDAAKAAVAQGRSGELLAEASTGLRSEFSSIFGEAALEVIDRLSIRSDGQTRVRLPFTVPTPRVDEAAEVQLLDLVNRERRAAGLPPLQMDPTLRRVAREHSAEMFDGGYFSHRGENGSTPADRARAAGVRGVAIGENIALAPNVEVAHRGLMESPPHRANILHPDYNRVGIGIVDGGLHGKMVTQDFAG